MAVAADRARFYLEQSIPDLQDLERKKIFSKDEITSIIKKRSDFEHKINARGTKPADFVRYTEFEINLETLRSKRAKRLGVKNRKQIGQRRALFVLDRATKRLHGDLKLWWFYLDIAKKQKAYSKVTEILTNLVRLHPTKPEVWRHAATYAIDEHGDMTEARSHFQRGLRFCKNSKELWLSYARTELTYISKIITRQQILGLVDLKIKQENGGDLDDPDADVIALPTITAQDVDPTLRAMDDADGDALQSLLKTPALSGAIPIAIFDAATAHIDDVAFSGQFFDLVWDLQSIPCSTKIAQHVLHHLKSKYPNDPVTLDCCIRQPMLAISPATVEFPVALGNAFTRLKSSLDDHCSVSLIRRTVCWVSQYLKLDLDESVGAALRALLLRTFTKFKSLVKTSHDPSGDDIASMLELVAGNAPDVVVAMLPWALDVWPSNERLIRSRDTLPP